MQHFGAATARRRYLYANSHVVSKLDRGRLQRRTQGHGRNIKTCEKYRDKAGKLRYKGAAFLKKTESLDEEKLFCF